MTPYSTSLDRNTPTKLLKRLPGPKTPIRIKNHTETHCPGFCIYFFGIFIPNRGASLVIPDIPFGITQDVRNQVKLLIKLAHSAKLSGIIASAQDIKLAREISKNMKIFCPGIRGDQNTQDQKRTLSYKEFNVVADDRCFAVIGRPIYEGDPLENIKKIINSAK